MDRRERVAALRAGLVEGDGADRALDAKFHALFVAGGGPPEAGARLYPAYANAVLVPCYTASLDAVTRFLARAMPGWWASFGLCYLSGDATLCPDHNDPAHRDRLLRDYPPDLDPFDGGFSADLRPGDGWTRPCRAMMVTFLDAAAFIADRAAEAPSDGA